MSLKTDVGAPVMSWLVGRPVGSDRGSSDTRSGVVVGMDPIQKSWPTGASKDDGATLGARDGTSLGMSLDPVLGISLAKSAVGTRLG